MNKTKKITQGSMMLAIIGALMLIDRQLSYLFSDILLLLMPIVIIIYSTMHTIKDGLILLFGLGVLTILFGTPTVHYIYFPIEAIVGIGYALAIKRNLDKRALLFIAIGLFVAGELTVYFVIFPLIGIDLKTQLEQSKLLYDTMIANYPTGTMAVLETINVNVILMSCLVVSTILMGVMEGFIIHMLSVFLLKRLKVKDLGNTSLYDMKVKPLVAYLSIIAFSMIFLLQYIKNDLMLALAVVLCSAGAIILVYLGYVFAILYGRIVLRRNIGIFVLLFLFLFMPFSIFIIAIMGFMYGAGPLRSFLERKVEG